VPHKDYPLRGREREGERRDDNWENENSDRRENRGRMERSNESERARERKRKVREKREGEGDWWKRGRERERVAETLPQLLGTELTEGFQV
jgi:hypothetical protein